MNMFNILLDTMALAIHNLNMFKADKHAKGEQTREEILDSALELFRQHGFDATTMRDIALTAGVALGRLTTISPAKTPLCRLITRKFSKSTQHAFVR